MASPKIYIKKGNKNYKENKLLKELTEVFEKKISEDPNFQFKPAENFSELQRLHSQYCVEDANVVSDTATSSNANAGEGDSTADVDTSTANETPPVDKFDSDAPFVDPMNREEPNVRSYVTDDQFPDEKAGADAGPAKTNWDEPTSFGESFEIPGDEDTVSSEGKATSNEGGGKNVKSNNPERQKPNPINPDFNEMSSGKKKRSTKKFAKYIVETVCMLAEKGFVWYANKDINDAKLAEYELNGTMDLNLLLEMEDGQTRTVKKFFQEQCMAAEQLSKIDPEEKQDLIDALAEVLLEKGVAPTPMQELSLIGLKIFGGQAIALLQIKSQTNSLIQQLKDMAAGYTSYEEEPSAQPQQEKAAQKQEPVTTNTPVSETDLTEDALNETEPTEMPYKNQASDSKGTDADDLPIISHPQTTLE